MRSDLRLSGVYTTAVPFRMYSLGGLWLSPARDVLCTFI